MILTKMQLICLCNASKVYWKDTYLLNNLNIYIVLFADNT